MRAIATLVAGILAAAPAIAEACPACAGRDDGGKIVFFLVLGMMALPFGIARIALKAMRREEQALGQAETEAR